MKVIFLDNDGVICLSNNWGSRFKKQKKWGKRKLSMSSSEIPVKYRFDNFDIKSVKTLNEILEMTDAEIIVSSDWRYHATLEELGDYYESQGIIKRPMCVTPYISDIDPEIYQREFRFYAKLEQERALEIRHTLGLFPSITNWVVIDDLFMGTEIKTPTYSEKQDWGLTNFVYTSKSSEGIKQSGVKEKVLEFLL